MSDNELVQRVEEILRTAPDVAFQCGPRRPFFMITEVQSGEDLGSIKVDRNGPGDAPRLLVETFPSDGLEQTTFDLDGRTYSQTVSTVSAALTWLQQRRDERTSG